MDGASEPEAEAVDALIGRNIGHFRVDSLLGHGGMGAVYRAFDLSLDRPVALKTVLLDNEHTRALFVREARAQAKLRHANVVPVHYIGDHEGLTYLVMELVDGESLAAKIEREGAVPELHACGIIDAVAAALESAHAQGLIHRDVKPSNVLVEANGRVLLADFGLAKVVGAGEDGALSAPLRNGALVSQMNTKGAIGTPAYIAPELTSGQGKVDHRADIYSLGVTFYELVTGQRPFTGPTNTRVAAAHERAPVIAPRIINPNLSRTCEAIIMRMLAKAPEERYQTYAALRADLADARATRLPAAVLTRLAAFTLDIFPVLFLDLFVKGAAAAGWMRLVVWLITVVVYASFESKRGRTWGKDLIGIHTVDDLGRAPKFAAAFVRSIVKLWGPLIAGCFVASVPNFGSTLSFSVNGQSQAAQVSSTSIVVDGIWLVWILVTPLVAARKSRAALHDMVARTHVILDLRST